MHTSCFFFLGARWLKQLPQHLIQLNRATVPRRKKKQMNKFKDIHFLLNVYKFTVNGHLSQAVINSQCMEGSTSRNLHVRDLAEFGFFLGCLTHIRRRNCVKQSKSKTRCCSPRDRMRGRVFRWRLACANSNAATQFTTQNAQRHRKTIEKKQALFQNSKLIKLIKQ